MRLLLALLVMAEALALPMSARAAEPALTLKFRGELRTLSSAELLARPDAAMIEIPADAAYGQPMTYRAVPLLGIIGALAGTSFDTLEATASDGFVAQIPLALVRKGAEGGSVAWLAVEDPAAPWPALPGKTVSAGPFYVVWEHPERSHIGNEQWPYQLASLAGAESPTHRWPQMAVSADLPKEAPARRGEAVFVTQCLPCHRMKGGGAADIGPDLGMPMSPMQYMSAEGLRALIRNPKAVRSWPGQQMPGFDTATLPEPDLDALISYLTYMAATPR